MTPLRLGTRGSALALAQARSVADALGADVELVTIVTAGDQARDVGDKSRWTGALERALLAGEIDLAVHSAKDVPGELADGCVLAGAPPRGDPRDALIGALSLAALPPGARIGTSALRRAALINAEREDLEVVELRGNVDTRLAKLERGEVDAIVLALAGLDRLAHGRRRRASTNVNATQGSDPGVASSPVNATHGSDPGVASSFVDVARTPLDSFVPAPGQGILALETRADDGGARAAAERITDAATWRCLAAERAVVRALGASCRTPVGANAAPDGDGLVLRAFVGLPDGSEWIRDELRGEDPAALGAQVAERMQAAGAADLLRRAEELAPA